MIHDWRIRRTVASAETGMAASTAVAPAMLRPERYGRKRENAAMNVRRRIQTDYKPYLGSRRGFYVPYTGAKARSM